MVLWFGCFALHIHQLSVGRLVSWETVSGMSFANDALPEVIGSGGIFSRTSGLVSGDQVIRLGDTDVRGVGSLSFRAIALAQVTANGVVPVAYLHNGEPRVAEFRLEPLPRRQWAAILSLAFAGLALLVFLRMGDSRFGRFNIPAFVTYGIWWLPFSGGPEAFTYADFVIRTSAAAFALPMILRGVLVFPDSLPDPSPRSLRWPWIFVVLVFLRMGVFQEVAGEFGVQLPSGPLKQLANAMGMMYGVALIGIASYNYRRTDAIGRRQVNWVIFGIYTGMLPMLFCYFAIAVDPDPIWVIYRDSVFTEPALLMIPACTLIAIARWHLFDINRILSVTASYTVIVVAGIAGLLVIVPASAEWLSQAVGIGETTSRVALSVLMAAVVVPAHLKLRPQIDRIFFTDRYALETGVNELIEGLSGCESPQEMLTRAGQTLDDLVHPESCVIYARVGDDYAPVFVHGSAVPTVFDEDSGLLEELRLRREPLTAHALTRTVQRVDLGPVERASLEALAAAVIVPIKRSKTLIAFLCLGPKNSGDIYTSTDLTLLGAVASSLSAELSRFSEVELLRHKMEMYESLRSYVPRVITEELESGRSIEPRLQHVSVMFADIRGYSTWAESQQPDVIFSTLNRYTDIVSTNVNKHGGSLVEFSGDGIMAVFGAPQELPQKERAALEAARALSVAMADFDVGSGEKLEVGIGIATGEALVGNIHSVDRLIWSAIGNTTNLAARLQSMSRDLDVGIVIDAATYQAAAGDTGEFKHHPSVRIRGRQRTFDVYTLPRHVAERHLRQLG